MELELLDDQMRRKNKKGKIKFYGYPVPKEV